MLVVFCFKVFFFFFFEYTFSKASPHVVLGGCDPAQGSTVDLGSK